MFKREKSIEQIIDGCISGKRNCQELLFKKFHGKMKVVVMRYIKDADTAQDVLSDAFVKVFAKINSFEKNGSIEGWVRKIVANTAIDAIRKNKKTFFLEDSNVVDHESLVTQPEGDDFEIEGINTSEITPEEYLGLIQELSPCYRAVFNMKLFENMSHKEIANILEVAEGTSKSNYSKARAILKDKVINLAKEKEKEKVQEKMKLLYKEVDVAK
jgi:RNA polymerase sigma-70 factor (ECF subfamily)